MQRLSRRGLLRGAAGVAAGCWASQLWKPALDALAETLDPPAVVVAEGTNEDSAEVLLRAALAPLGGIERFVKPGQTVCIKPNATWMNPPHTASSTDPDLLRALIAMVKAAGASRVIIVDRSVFDPPAMVLDVSGLGAVIEETGAEAHVLDRYVEPKSKYTDIDIPQGKAFRNISVIKAAVEADVRINMAVAKTHIVVPVTLCCKHMMGFLETPPELHTGGLDQGIADIGTAPAIKPVLHILEAIRARVRGAAYGDGTDITDPDRVKRLNKIIAGTDPVLIDAWATANIFGRSPMEVTHIKRCFESGLGEIDVEKAIASGRLQRFRPAQVLITPTPTVTATPTPAPEVQPTTVMLPEQEPTATAIPTPVPTRAPTRRPAGEEIIDINTVLNAPLVPLAAVIGGVGMVVGRRLVGGLRQQSVASPEPEAVAPSEEEDERSEEPLRARRGSSRAAGESSRSHAQEKSARPARRRKGPEESHDR
ncbi:MAG: DUF362 domain-containing protein [Anaerolineae bacterium]|nr:DUF362 domain-containing protein [Anaerolineae bacterium]